jgi:two-component system, OmpR family, sensor histidine kinase VanS
LRNKYSKSVTVKIFGVTSMLLVISAFLIYLIMYSMLPKFYYNYKRDTVKKGLQELTENISGAPIKDAVEQMDDFIEKYNVAMRVLDPEGRVVYIPSNFVRFTENNVHREAFRPMRGTQGYQSLMRERFVSRSANVYTVFSEVSFAEEDTIFTLYVNAPLQPIDEASRVLIMFTPYIGLIVIIISIIGALIYSRLLAHPLVNINKVAKQMSELNFSEKCVVKGEDEIGELSSSLNTLSMNLQKTMGELTSANEKLMDDIAHERELERKRREFTATISHELKTPITVLKGQLEGMISNIGAYKDRDKYLNRSLFVLESMEGIVREILDISRLESNGFSPVIEKVDISSMTRECIQEISYLAEEKDIVIKSEIEDRIYINADRKLIKKAVANIIKNAVVHTGRGETVEVKLLKTDNRVKLELDNTGVFIPEEEIKEIFKPFYRIEKSRNRSTGGSGLGLYIVQKVLDAHNAFYSISNTDKGVIFVIIFKS